MMDERDADRKAEMPEDSRKGRGGTSPGTGRERQAPAAAEEISRSETTTLLEEALHRENLKVVCTTGTCELPCEISESY